MEIILDTGSTLISSKMDSVFAFEKIGLFGQKDRFFYLAIIDPFKCRLTLDHIAKLAGVFQFYQQQDSVIFCSKILLCPYFRMCNFSCKSSR